MFGLGVYRMSDYRAAILLQQGRDILLESLDELDPSWRERFDSPDDAAIFHGLGELTQETNDYDNDGAPKELNFNHQDDRAWADVADWDAGEY